MRCTVVKGGWWWLGVEQQAGAVIDAPAEWVANRVADGLVEQLPEEQAIETATTAPAETAVSPRGRARRKS